MNILHAQIGKLTIAAAVLVALAACAPVTSTNPASTSAVPTTGALVAPTFVPSLVPALPTQPAQPTTSGPAGAPTAASQVTITLGPGRDANQPGTAVLVAQGDKTQVTLNMQNSQPGVAQPAHIHEGTCPGVGPVKYPLSNVVDGKSVTVVNAPLSELLKGNYALNVHKSTTEAGVYVACAAVTGASSSGTTSGPVSVTLGPGRDGSQTGTADLIPQGDKTQVVINIQPGSAGVAQPAHIHVGTCPGVGAVKYPLTNVVDGKSSTVVDAKLSDLVQGGYAINVHRSAQEAGIYVACGAIETTGTKSSPVGAPTTTSGASSSSSY